MQRPVAESSLVDDAYLSISQAETILSELNDTERDMETPASHTTKQAAWWRRWCRQP